MEVPIDGDPSPAERLPSWSATAVYALLAATLAAFALGLGFFLEEGVFAPLSDAAAFAVAVVLAPVAWALYRMDGPTTGSHAILVVGIAAAVATAVASVGLIVRNVLLPSLDGLPFLGSQFAGIALQGAWLTGTGWLGIRLGTRTRRTAWAGALAGVGYLVGVAGLSAGFDFMHPTVSFGLLAGFVGFVAWGLSLGAELRTIREGTAARSRAEE